MKHYTYLVAGGGLAAARAIEGIREVDHRGSIILVGEEPHLPYDRPPLSKAALSSGVSPKEIAIHSRWYYLKARSRLKRAVAVTSLDLEGPSPTARLSNGEEFRFDRAIIATGARPRPLPVAGSELPGFEFLRNVDDALRIRSRLLAGGEGAGRRVVIIGAGFIGLEAAASLASLGTEVTVLEQASSVWPTVAPESVAAFLQEYLVSLGVRIEFGARVEGFRGGKRLEEVVLSSGASIAADLVLLAVGVVPNEEIAREAGVPCDNGILVDEYLHSSVETIWAAGDVASVPDPYGDSRRRFEHYGSAEATGYLAGKNAAGAGEPFTMVPYVWSDIGEHRVDVVGNEQIRDETILRGEPATGRFFVLSLRGKKLVSFFSVNGGDADRSALQLLIKQRVDLSEVLGALTDETVPLQQLVHKAMAG